MNFDPSTRKLVRSWMRAHVTFIRSCVQRLQSVSVQPIGQPFNGEDEEYIITAEGVGYHVEYDLDMNNGTLRLHAVPGHFVDSSNGPIWINGKTALHSEIERVCDNKETSLLIQ